MEGGSWGTHKLLGRRTLPRAPRGAPRRKLRGCSGQTPGEAPTTAPSTSKSISGFIVLGSVTMGCTIHFRFGYLNPWGSTTKAVILVGSLSFLDRSL